MKKFFLICLALLLTFQGAAAAKQKGLPEEDRIKIAVEVFDTSRHRDELRTAELLELFLSNKLTDKNLINVLNAENFSADKKSDGLIRDEEVTADNPSPVENFGELLIFDAVELPPPVDVAKNFDQARYQNLGATYVVRCEVLALGLTKVTDKTIDTITTILGTGFSIGGSGNGSRDKTLRRIGTGINVLGMIGVDVTKRTALNTVVNMQFIDVSTGKVLWQANFTGQAVKHHSPGKNFNNAWERAFSESVEDSAKLISKRVNKYVDKVIIKGKSDKDFLPKKFSIGSFNTGKFF